MAGLRVGKCKRSPSHIACVAIKFSKLIPSQKWPSVVFYSCSDTNEAEGTRQQVIDAERGRTTKTTDNVLRHRIRLSQPEVRRTPIQYTVPLRPDVQSRVTLPSELNSKPNRNASHIRLGKSHVVVLCSILIYLSFIIFSQPWAYSTLCMALLLLPSRGLG